jgi:hypothetical protein
MQSKFYLEKTIFDSSPPALSSFLGGEGEDAAGLEFFAAICILSV